MHLYRVTPKIPLTNATKSLMSILMTSLNISEIWDGEYEIKTSQRKEISTQKIHLRAFCAAFRRNLQPSLELYLKLKERSHKHSPINSVLLTFNGFLWLIPAPLLFPYLCCHKVALIVSLKICMGIFIFREFYEPWLLENFILENTHMGTDEKMFSGRKVGKKLNSLRFAVSACDTECEQSGRIADMWSQVSKC